MMRKHSKEIAELGPDRYWFQKSRPSMEDNSKSASDKVAKKPAFDHDTSTLSARGNSYGSIPPSPLKQPLGLTLPPPTEKPSRSLSTSSSPLPKSLPTTCVRERSNSFIDSPPPQRSNGFIDTVPSPNVNHQFTSSSYISNFHTSAFTDSLPQTSAFIETCRKSLREPTAVALTWLPSTPTRATQRKQLYASSFYQHHDSQHKYHVLQKQRNIDEILPYFTNLHMNLGTHLLRCNVPEHHLLRKDSPNNLYSTNCGMKSFAAPSLNKNQEIANACISSNCIATKSLDQFHSANHIRDVKCERCSRVKFFRNDWNCSDLRQSRPRFLFRSIPRTHSCVDFTSSEALEKKANETPEKKHTQASFDNLVNEFGRCTQNNLRQQRSLIDRESDSSKALFCRRKSLRYQRPLLNCESDSSKSHSQQGSCNSNMLSPGFHRSFASSSNTYDYDYLTSLMMPKPDTLKKIPLAFEKTEFNSTLPAPKSKIVDYYLYSNVYESSAHKALVERNTPTFQSSLDVPSIIGINNCDDALSGNLDIIFNNRTSRHKDATTEEKINSVFLKDDEGTDSFDSLQDLYLTKKSGDMNRCSTTPRPSVAAETQFSLAYEEEIPSCDKMHILEDFSLDTVTRHTAPKDCIELTREEDESVESFDLNGMAFGLCDPAYPNKVCVETSSSRFLPCPNRIQNKQYQDRPRRQNLICAIRPPIGHEDDINFVGNFMWSRGIKDDQDIQSDCNPNEMDTNIDDVCKQVHTHTCKDISSDAADCIRPGCSVLGIAVDAALDLLPPEYAEPTEYVTSLNGEGLCRPQDRGWLESVVSCIVSRRENISKNGHHLFQPPNLSASNGVGSNLIKTDFPVNIHDENSLGFTAANDKSAKVKDRLLNRSEQDLTDEEFYFVYLCTKKEFYGFPCWIRIQKRAEGKDRRLLLLQTEAMSKNIHKKEEDEIEKNAEEAPT